MSEPWQPWQLQPVEDRSAFFDEIQDDHDESPFPQRYYRLQGMETPHSLISDYPSLSSSVPTLSSNSNPSVFSGSSRSSGSSTRVPYRISTRRAHQRSLPPISASSRMSSLAFDSFHDDNHQMPTQQSGIAPEMAPERAADPQLFRGLGRSLRTMAQTCSTDDQCLRIDFRPYKMKCRKCWARLRISFDK
jgi:hypothetical protein